MPQNDNHATQPARRASRPTGKRGAFARLALLGAVVIVVAGAVAAYFGVRPQSAGSGTSAALVPASTRSFEITTLASGELQTRNKVEVRSQVEGQTSIVEIVDEGKTVKPGDVIVRLSSEEIEREIAEEELRVEEARAELEAAETAEKIQASENASQLRAAQSALSLAKLAYQQWEEGDVVKRKQADDLAVEKAEKNLSRLEEKYEQSKQLYEREFLSKDELDRDEIDYIEARAALAQAKLDQEVYLKFQYQKEAEQYRLDVLEAEDELERVSETNAINLRSKQASTLSRRRQLGLREERLAKLEAQLEACTIVARQSGLVVYGTSTEQGRWRAQNEGAMDVGRQVRHNDLIIQLPDTSEMIASVKVHESLAGRIRPGQTAVVSIDAKSMTISGKVESVGVLAESGGWRDPNRREYTVLIALESQGDSTTLKPTMRCEARITLGEVDDTLTVPVPAVFNEGAVRFVYVPAGDRFERRPVLVGRRSDTDAEIIAGLTEGERVLVRDPASTEVVNEPWDPDALAAAGYTTAEDGSVVPDRTRMRELMSSRGGSEAPEGRQRGGRPAPAEG